MATSVMVTLTHAGRETDSSNAEEQGVSAAVAKVSMLLRMVSLMIMLAVVHLYIDDMVSLEINRCRRLC